MLNTLKKVFNFGMRHQVMTDCVDRAARYWALNTPEAQAHFQVDAFNAVWEDAVRNVPFYADWRTRYHLPSAIRKLEELEEWPILRKPDLQERADLLERTDRPPDHRTYTGGATGEPLHFGTFCSFGRTTAVNQSMGRALNGIEPTQRCFLLWGHTHLWGTGFGRIKHVLARRIKDILSGKLRLAATDLSPVGLEQACIRLIRFKPGYVVAYSRTLLALCRMNPHQREACRDLRLKAIVCSAGNLSFNERTEISNFFQTVVVMEYGSMECGVMAYTDPSTSDYNVFWDTHLIHDEQDAVGMNKIIVTLLTPCYLPLIRYDIGDYFHPQQIVGKRVMTFSEVIGRDCDMIRLSDGTIFHGMVFFGAVEQVSKIVAYQAVIFPDRIELHVVVKEPLNPNEKAFLIKRSQEIVPTLRNQRILLIEKEQLIRAPSGKIRLVVYEKAGSQ